MAETLNITRSALTEDGDSADRAKLPDHSSKPRSKPRVSSQGQLTILLVSIAITIALGAWLYQQWTILDYDMPFATGAIRIIVLVIVPLATILGGLGWIYGKVQQSRLVRLESDHPVSVELALRGQLAASSLQAYYQTQAVWAANSGLRSLNQLDMSQTKPAEIKAPAMITESPLALVADSEWLGWIDNTPHLMIAGQTNAGKTTLATAVLAQREEELLCVLDPHDQPGKWFGARAIGGGRDYEAIVAALRGLTCELDDRYIAYNAGSSDFARLSVLIDEVPAIVARDKRSWAAFVTPLGSEARKVAMSIILLTQSPLVRDIEISSVMRENFTRIALGDQASVLVRDEPDSKRKAALQELLRGQQYPAAMEYRSEVHLLDTSNVPVLARNAGRRTLWLPREASPMIDRASVTRKALQAMKRQGWTREQARATGLQFDNNTWGDV